MPDVDATRELAEQVRDACDRRAPLNIVGGGTKAFYGRAVDGEPLRTSAHQGIVRYDPAELVITARAGTPLEQLEAELANHGQYLPFEPPHFGRDATVGGMVAAGLAGPARVSAGTVRDYVLGVSLLTGDARTLRFGGEVIKNVAGYDVSRLLAGSLGILGVLLEVSIKVLPRRPASMTQVLELAAAAAMEKVTRWATSTLPLTASCWSEGRLHVRFDASAAALDRVRRLIGGESLADADAFWGGLREHSHPFFHAPGRLLRSHVAAQTPTVESEGQTLMEWHGTQRWYRDVGPSVMSLGRESHVTVFRGGDGNAEVFAPLSPGLRRLHEALKRIFDPAGILNPGRMYRGL